jgi:hypothetical protein
MAGAFSEAPLRSVVTVPGDTTLTAILIRAQINSSVADHALRDDLLHLKRLGMIDSRGHG